MLPASPPTPATAGRPSQPSFPIGKCTANPGPRKVLCMLSPGREGEKRLRRTQLD